MSKRVAVVLSGCGYLDGSEISESIIALLALDRAGARVSCAAPERPQMHVVDHLSGTPTSETRDVQREAARIARGKVMPLSKVHAADFDAIFLPGGYGAAKNLSTVAVDGPNATVDPELSRVLREFREAGKPIGAVCIAPAVVVAALREGEVTIGRDPGTAAAIRQMGGVHHEQPVEGIQVDRARKIVTAPAYMYDNARISAVADGIEAAVRATLDLA